MLLTARYGVHVSHYYCYYFTFRKKGFGKAHIIGVYLLHLRGDLEILVTAKDSDGARIGHRLNGQDRWNGFFLPLLVSPPTTTSDQ